MKLPKFEALAAAFLGPKYDSQAAARVIGGVVYSNVMDPNQPEYKNTCALRVSRSLNYAGAKIPFTETNPRVNSGADRLWYIYSVDDLEGYLALTYGAPDVRKKGKSNGDVTGADFVGKKGIILFKSFHTDLWNGAGCEGYCYFNAVNEVMLWEAP